MRKYRLVSNILLAVAVLMTLIPARATAYCITGTTASGEYTREGICAGGSRYFGKTITIYQRLPDGSVGDKIGTYECKDKGATPGIKNNYVIDVWQEDLEHCQEFMDLVYKDGCEGKIYIHIEE